MMRQNDHSSGRAYLSAILLFAVGMAAGALVYAFLFSSQGETTLDAAHEKAQESVEPNHEEGEEGIIQIPIEAQTASGLQVAPAAMQQIETSLQVTGTVAPDQTRVAHIRPLARGVVEEVFVQMGDRVRQGDPLISYDNIKLGMAVGEYLAAKADLRSTQTSVEVKETILARSREMLAVGAIARTTHDIREAEFREAQAQVDAAQARVSKVEEQLHRFGLTDDDLQKLNAAHDTDYHRTASHSILRAPFSGVITAYDVSVGETVDPSSELLTLTDISTVWVLADVYEQNLSAVRVGKQVAIRIASYPDEVFQGRITYISDLVEPKTRTARVRCVADNPRARLKLDMFATVEIPTEETAQVLAVPTAAIQRIDDEPVVFVQLTETEFERRDVTTGIEAGGWTEIRSGLKPAERVISEGSFHAKTAALRELIGDEH
jgi:cobalt-zinc-cadmium efflux system membrane fusion protein